MKLDKLRVVVVGGALGGASVALFLARAGAHVTLLEREAKARAVGAGIALAENGLAVLAALGLEEAVSSVSCELPGVRVCDATGRTLFVPPGRAPGVPAIVRMARRSCLYALLTEALARETRVLTQYGAHFRALDAAGNVTWERAAGRLQTQADLVIGADGVHSSVRAASGFGAQVRSAGIAYVRGLAPQGMERNEEAWTRAGLFGSFAVPGGTYWYASLGHRSVRRAMAARDLDAFRSTWRAAYPACQLLESVGSLDELLVNEVLTVECARYVKGRVVLLGDAAHAMAPNLGQGANSALVDACVLYDELQKATTLEAALTAYDVRRRPKVSKVAKTSARLGRLAEQTHPVARFLRDRVLMPLAALGDGTHATRMALQEDPEALSLLGPARARDCVILAGQGAHSQSG